MTEDEGMEATNLTAEQNGRKSATQDFKAKRLVDFTGPTNTTPAACAYRKGYWERLDELVNA